MWTGKRYKLNRSTLTVRALGDERTLLTIPPNSVVQVLSGPKIGGDRMVTVLWDGRTVEMFASDLEERGTEVKG